MATTDHPVSVESIKQAANNIAHQINRTPLHTSRSLSSNTRGDIHLKLECLQTTGSFKLRGATNAMRALSDRQKQKGVVCVSTGNHGRGLAYAARQNGIPAIICMSRLARQNKIDGIRALGAEVRIIGNSQDEAQREVDRLIKEDGMTMIPPFDHPDVITGQGTIGLEILDQLPRVDTLVVPLSGGGLIAGIACAVKSTRPATRIVGVSMERGCAMHQSIRTGHPVQVEELPTLADALSGGIGLDNRYTFQMVQHWVDDTAVVSESQIANAIRHAYFDEQLIVEGSGAVGIAAILHDVIHTQGNTVVVVSGRNIDMALHQKIINRQTPDSI